MIQNLHRKIKLSLFYIYIYIYALRVYDLETITCMIQLAIISCHGSHEMIQARKHAPKDIKDHKVLPQEMKPMKHLKVNFKYFLQ